MFFLYAVARFTKHSFHRSPLHSSLFSFLDCEKGKELKSVERLWWGGGSRTDRQKDRRRNRTVDELPIDPLLLFRFHIYCSLPELESNQFHRRDQRKMRLNYSCVHLSIPFYPRRDRQEKDYHRHRPNWQDSSSIQDLVTVSDSPRPPSTVFSTLPTTQVIKQHLDKIPRKKKKLCDTVSPFGL